MRQLPDNNLSYPVLIEIGPSSGSGFYFLNNQIGYLATALHVIQNNNQFISNTLKLISYDSDLTKLDPIIIEVDLTRVNIRKKDSIDVALLQIMRVDRDGHFEFADGVKKITTRDTSIVVVPRSHLKRFEEVLISNDVFILGYPNSVGFPGQNQIDPMRPLLRKGIIAGLNRINTTIILDCPVYFGNSGGLAIEVELIDGKKVFKIIGVVVQYIPFIEIMQSVQLRYTNHNFENSGYSVVIPMDTLMELTDEQPIDNTRSSI